MTCCGGNRLTDRYGGFDLQLNSRFAEAIGNVAGFTPEALLHEHDGTRQDNATDDPPKWRSYGAYQLAQMWITFQYTGAIFPVLGMLWLAMVSYVMLQHNTQASDYIDDLLSKHNCSTVDSWDLKGLDVQTCNENVYYDQRTWSLKGFKVACENKESVDFAYTTNMWEDLVENWLLQGLLKWMGPFIFTYYVVEVIQLMLHDCLVLELGYNSDGEPEIKYSQGGIRIGWFLNSRGSTRGRIGLPGIRVNFMSLYRCALALSGPMLLLVGVAYNSTSTECTRTNYDMVGWWVGAWALIGLATCLESWKNLSLLKCTPSMTALTLKYQDVFENRQFEYFSIWSDRAIYDCLLVLLSVLSLALLFPILAWVRLTGCGPFLTTWVNIAPELHFLPGRDGNVLLENEGAIASELHRIADRSIQQAKESVKDKRRS